MINFNLGPVFCAHHGVVVLEQTDSHIVIGMLNVDDQNICEKLEARYIQYLKYYMHIDIGAERIAEFISYKNIPKHFFIKEASRNLVTDNEVPVNTLFHEERNTEHVENLEYLIEDAPIIHLLNSLLLECVEKEGSDIHIEPFADGCRIKMRVLGELELYSIIDIKTATALVLRILFLAGLDITETRRIQDGSFHFEAGVIETEVRVSVLPSQFGSSCVLRLLPCKAFSLTFEGLGFTPSNRAFLEDVCSKSNALVLVCGATGAGKSTTLAAILNRLRGKKRKIITIEDPIEYRIDEVVQVPVNSSLEMDFSHVLRSAFRHDPDVIMIGEIRDEKTARIAVRAALTGHLVLASLHTIDAPSAIIRLLDMGIEQWLLASVFGGALCQKLIKKGTEKEQHYAPLAEAIPGNTEISKLILQNASVHEYREWMQRNGIISMNEEELYVACF